MSTAMLHIFREDPSVNQCFHGLLPLPLAELKLLFREDSWNCEKTARNPVAGFLLSTCITSILNINSCCCNAIIPLWRLCRSPLVYVILLPRITSVAIIRVKALLELWEDSKESACLQRHSEHKSTVSWNHLRPRRSFPASFSTTAARRSLSQEMATCCVLANQWQQMLKEWWQRALVN